MLIDQAQKLWNLDSPLELVRKASNEVYRAHQHGKEVFLRLTFPNHRAKTEIEAEIEWMLSLRDSGINVVAPLISNQGTYVETLGRNEAYAVLFEKGEGHQAHKLRDYTTEVAASWGRLLAQLQKHSRTFVPKHKRPPWNEDRVFHLAIQEARKGNTLEQTRFLEITNRLKTLPTTNDVYGLTHADLHLGNFTIFEDKIFAFDFDDSCYHWFAHDVAVGVVSIRKAAWENPGLFDPDAIEEVFVRAYRNEVSSNMDHLDLFIQYRLALSACWGAALEQTDEEIRAWYQKSLPWWREQLARF